MDAPDSDFETADSAPKAKTASKRQNAAKQLAHLNKTKPPAPQEESESIQDEGSTKAPEASSNAVQFHRVVAPVYRERRLIALARKDKDVRWLIEENARLKKQLSES